MWNKLLANLWPFKGKEPESSVPESTLFEEDEFTPTLNTELRLKSLNLSDDKVQRIFSDFAFRFVIGDIYKIKDIREKEMRDKNEFLPEELEQLKDEYQIIALLLEFERKDFIYKCSINHLELLRKTVRELHKNKNLTIDNSANPELRVFWLENCSKLLLPFDTRLMVIKKKIYNELKEAGILKEDDSNTAPPTDEKLPPVGTGEHSDVEDLVLDDADKKGKADSKKSSLNFK
jgi:hypothetical protein